MEKRETLDCLEAGEVGEVICLETAGDMRRRFLDLGLVEGTRVECIGKSPAGDPAAYLIRGAVIAIRQRSCEGIVIRRSERRSDEE